MMRTAERLKGISERLEVPLIFKSSFSKDNRSSLEYYQGPGLEAGLRMLEKIKREFDSADPHGHSLPLSGGAGRRGLRRHPDSRVPVHAVGARRRGGQDGRRRQHQARPVLGAREHGEARQEDRGLRQRSHHRDGARLHVRLQRSRRRSAQLLLAESDRLPRRVRRGPLDPQVRHPEQGSARQRAAILDDARARRPWQPASTVSSSRRTRARPMRSAMRRANTLSTISRASCDR